jgi:hypothetical protein
VAWSTSGTSDISPAGLCAIVNGNAASSGPGGPFYGASTTQSFSGDSVKVALYNGSPTSATAQAATLAQNAYNGSGGQWVTANEVSSTNYTAGGVVVTPKTETLVSTTVVTFTSSGTPTWTTVSFTSYGCLVYDNTVTGAYAFCWNYFGGAQTVTAGTFSITWNASGIFAITCT